MKLTRYIIFTVLICQIPSAWTSNEENTAQPGVVSGVVQTANFMLDMLCAPLAYFSTGPQHELMATKDFIAACDLMQLTDPTTDQLKEAYEKLSLSAIEGHKLALFHMGSLMVGLPEPRWRKLSPLVPYDQQMGLAYLSAALRKGVESSKGLLVQMKCLKLLTQAVDYAYGLSQGQNEVRARALINKAVTLKSPHVSFYMAEAILKRNNSTYPWMFVDKLSLYNRRVKSLALLDICSKASHPEALSLICELEKEDNIYEALCTEILDNSRNKINDISLGEAGYQEAYIDEVCKSRRPILGKILTPTRAHFLKEAMIKRVALVFQFLSDYSQYVYKCNSSSKNVTKFIDPTQALKLIVDYIVGKKEVTIPSIINDDDKVVKEQKTYSFQEALLCPVTLLDATTAYRQMIEGDDDFQNPLPPEPEEE